jgi:hypothetical protein
MADHVDNRVLRYSRTGCRVRNALALAVGNAGAQEVQELIELARDPRLGESRLLVLGALDRVRRSKSVPGPARAGHRPGPRAGDQGYPSSPGAATASAACSEDDELSFHCTPFVADPRRLALRLVARRFVDLARAAMPAEPAKAFSLAQCAYATTCEDLHGQRHDRGGMMVESLGLMGNAERLLGRFEEARAQFRLAQSTPLSQHHAPFACPGCPLEATDRDAEAEPPLKWALAHLRVVRAAPAPAAKNRLSIAAQVPNTPYHQI